MVGPQMDLTQADRAFDRFMKDWADHGIYRFEKEFRPFVEEHGLEAHFDLSCKRSYHQQVLRVYKRACASRYNAMRRQQLEQAGFRLLIFKSTGDCHHYLDGLILPAADPFWAGDPQDADPDCTCYAIGTHSPTVAMRIGGNPQVVLPIVGPQTVPIMGHNIGRALHLSECIELGRDAGRA